MRPLYIIGAGGHCKTVVATARSTDHCISGILDHAQGDGETVIGVPIVGERSSYIRHLHTSHFFIGVGDNATRMGLHESIKKKGGSIISLKHADAKVDESGMIGSGSLLAQHVIICPSVSIGENVIVNSRALIEHDSVIENHVHIGPDVSLAGRVTVLEGAFIGLRAVIKDGVTIGRWAKVGAGAVVVHDVPDGATVVGNPAKIIAMDEYPMEEDSTCPLLRSGMTIRECLEEMDYRGLGHGVVVSESKEALGVVTDGRIRRFVLANGNIDQPVDEVMDGEFFYLPQSRERSF